MKPPYTCVRCGLTTTNKDNMRRHLYVKKVPCQGCMNNIELCEDIKQYILNNRIYCMPVQPVINNHIINNYILCTDFIDKIQKYSQYTQNMLTSIDDKLDNQYRSNVTRLTNDAYRHPFELNTDKLFEVIDEISNTSKVNDINLYYDSKSDKVHIYAGEWEERMSYCGMKRIINIIQSCYWNAYEIYLLRRIETVDMSLATQRCIELLEEYYKFIGCFEIYPYCKDKHKNEIMYNQGDPMFDVYTNDYALSDRFFKKYKQVTEKTSQSDVNAIKRRFIKILRCNTKKNIDKLNKSILELFHMDEGFKMCLQTKTSTLSELYANIQ